MQQRIDRLRELIEDDTAILISSYPNIFYFSGFMSEDAYLLISHDKLMLIIDSRYTIQAKEQSPLFEVVDIKKGWKEIFELIVNCRIGYEESHITVKQYNFLCEKAAGKEFLPMQSEINSLRRIKDAKELKLIAHAEQIGDEAFSYILKQIKPGKTEIEIALELEFFMKRQGASALSFETISASGIRSAMPHGRASDKVIENGDFLTLDFGCVYEGYCSDMTRTVVIGKANDRQKEIYNTVLTAQTAALEAIYKGKKCSEIDAVARDIITQAGFGENFGHGLGHSVGIEIHEAPSLSPKCDDIIIPGHVLTVEPGIYIENFGGVRIEDLIAVTEDSVINMTSSPKQLIEL